MNLIDHDAILGRLAFMDLLHLGQTCKELSILKPEMIMKYLNRRSKQSFRDNIAKVISVIIGEMFGITNPRNLHDQLCLHKVHTHDCDAIQWVIKSYAYTKSSFQLYIFLHELEKRMIEMDCTYVAYTNIILMRPRTWVVDTLYAMIDMPMTLLMDRIYDSITRQEWEGSNPRYARDIYIRRLVHIFDYMVCGITTTHVNTCIVGSCLQSRPLEPEDAIQFMMKTNADWSNVIVCPDFFEEWNKEYELYVKFIQYFYLENEVHNPRANVRSVLREHQPWMEQRGIRIRKNICDLMRL
jgi:hypothetical protein